MTRQVLRQRWEKRLRSFAKSGLSQAQWCRREDVALHQFCYWRKQLAQSEVGEMDASIWSTLEVAPNEPSRLGSAGGVSIRIGGACIEVEPGFDSATLRAVVQALEGPSC